MADFDKTSHLELPPKVDILFSGRRRVTRRFELGKNSNINDVIYRAYGDADPAEITKCTTGYADLRLIQQGVEPRSDPLAPSVLAQVFETLTSSWVEETGPKDETGENGRLRRTKVLVALPNTDYASYVVGTYTEDGLTLAQRLVEKTDAMWRLTLVLGDAGTLSQTTSQSNNGKLSTIVIESANEVPATPSGYVEVSRQVVGEDGFETTRYTFVKGAGEISRDTSQMDGGTSISIRQLSAPDVVTSPISAPSGYVLIDGPSKQEAEGHLVWAATFAKGNSATDTDLNGLLRTTVTEFYGPSDTPSAVTVGTTESGTGNFLAKATVVPTDVGKRRTLVYLQQGVLSKSKSPGPSGLPGTTTHEWETWKVDPTTTSPAIPGLVTSISQSNVGGYPTLRYTSIATAGGATPVGETLASYKTLIPINNPGELYVTRVAQGSGYVPYMVTKPPTKGQVKAAVTVKLLATEPDPVKPTAYNLDGLYVSVLQVSRTVAYMGSKSTDDGGVTVSLYSDQVIVKQDPVSGYIYKAPPSGSDYNGSTQNYTSPAGLEKSSDGTIVSTIDNTYYATITLSGSTTYPTPSSGDLIGIDVDPITLDTAGTVLYRVTEYKVP